MDKKWERVYCPGSDASHSFFLCVPKPNLQLRHRRKKVLVTYNGNMATIFYIEVFFAAFSFFFFATACIIRNVCGMAGSLRKIAENEKASGEARLTLRNILVFTRASRKKNCRIFFFYDTVMYIKQKKTKANEDLFRGSSNQATQTFFSFLFTQLLTSPLFCTG